MDCGKRCGRGRVLMRWLVMLALSSLALGVRAELPALVPRAVFFATAEHRNPKLSPDAKQLAYLAPDALRILQLWVRAVDNTHDRMLTHITNGSIHEFHWAPDSAALYYLQDHNGNERWQAFLLTLATGTAVALTPVGETVNDVQLLPDRPSEVLIQTSFHGSIRLTRYHVDSTGGTPLTAIPLPREVRDWVLAPDLHAFACLRGQPGGGRTLEVSVPATDTAEMSWRTLYQWSAEEHGQLLGYAERGKALLILSDKDAPALRLLRIDMASGESRVLAENAQSDATTMLSDADGVYAVEFEGEKPAWTVLDPRLTDDFAALAKLDAGVFAVSCRIRLADTWVVTSYADDASARYYLYSRATKRCTPLFSMNPRLADYTLAKRQPFSFTASDGLVIHGYLTAPVGVPAQKLPLVLLVHGGPWNRDHWMYHAQAQWLANRGYAVLQVNYRGSTGYGKRFLNAGNHAWGGKMQDDLTEAVAWAVAQGIADPKRVAIMGTSYGGYAALCGLAYTPDQYVAGVDLCGPSDLLALRQYRGDMSTPFGTHENLVIGDPKTEQDFLKTHSPSNAVEKIRAPLLIGQGANDPRVLKRLTDTLVATLRAANKPVDYYVYPDEGHGLAREANQLDFYAKVETFLAKYLGGRCETVNR